MDEATCIDGLCGAFRARQRGRGWARRFLLGMHHAASIGEAQQGGEGDSCRSLAGHGAPSSQRCRSLAGLNFASVGMLLPTAERASESVVPGTDLGMMR
jgi:hypothetical protein